MIPRTTETGGATGSAAALSGGLVTGLILAGGASRRFGADKSTYAVAGRSMLARVYDAVAPLVGEVLVAQRDAAQEPPPLAARVVYDRYPGLGPLAGLHAGLSACGTPWLLAVACDLPFVTSEALGLLLAARGAGSPAVVAVDSHGRRQPLCACYHTSLLPLVSARLAASELRLQALLDALPACRVVPLPDDALRNVNRPADLLPGREGGNHTEKGK